MLSNRPLVSVVIAAYNRSYVLRHAIQSVLDSTVTDLEVIVIGDGCTDDTGEVVASFRDPRVHFENLPAHGGDQSAPNSRGIDLARGRFIAMLNQDDLFFPDHLQLGIEHLERVGADFLWSATLIAEPATTEALHQGRWPVRLGSTPPAGVFDPLVFCLASSWIFRRELVDRVGRWRSGHEIYVTPSQDWMFRVWRSGAHMLFRPHASVLVINSGPRKNSYLLRQSAEHDFYAGQMRDNARFREELLESIAIAQAQTRQQLRRDQPIRYARRLLSAPLRRLCAAFDLHPVSIYVILFGPHKRGGVTAIHRQRVGLSPLPAHRVTSKSGSQ